MDSRDVQRIDPLMTDAPELDASTEAPAEPGDPGMFPVSGGDPNGEADTVVVPDGGLLGSPSNGAVGAACNEGSTACEAPDRLLVCEAGAYVELEVCPFVCQVDETGVATCGGECEPGSRTCSEDGTPAVCDDGGRFQPDEPCGEASPRCVEGECRACGVGERRCSEAGVPEVCSADGAAWVAEAACTGDNPVCVPEVGACGQCSPGSTRACVGALGNCAAGTQLCNSFNLWNPCSIQPATEDTCSPGDDADCDGQPNEGCDCTGPVSCGPPQAIGICRTGVSQCIGGEPGACQGAVFPAARNCASAADNDCNGSPDNALDATCQCNPGTDRACGQHPGLDGIGICREGRQTCVASAGNLSSSFGTCQGSVGPRARDCRSALDNDCNGIPDNRIDNVCQCVPGETRDCGIEPGSRGCARGTQTCQLGGGGSQSSFGACVFTDVPNGTQCDDGDAQTVGDSCQAGTCGGTRAGILAAGNTSCAIRSGGAVYCWSGIDGPFERIDLSVRASAVSIGGQSTPHGCAVLENGSVSCWGNNSFGTLGNGTTDTVTGTAAAAGLSDVVQVYAGPSNTAAVAANGAAFLWGGYDVPGLTQRELFGSSAPPLAFAVTTPTAIRNLSQIAQIAIGPRHACAVSNGQVLCWGSNDFSQLGRASEGNSDAQAAALVVPGFLGNDAVAISAGESYNCALRATGAVVCWGSLFTRDLANAINMPPTEVPQLSDASQVSVTHSSACALRRNGTVACWGSNDAGQLGTGDTTSSISARTVQNLDDAVLLGSNSALGGRSFCALRRGGQVVCWGEAANQPTPFPVAGLPD